MDRTTWVSRFIRRMETLDVTLRPAELAEMASAAFDEHGALAPEAVADKQGQGHVRRDD
ncbi:MAG: hypothetical protein ABI281_12080 [Caldimonas sp.]